MFRHNDINASRSKHLQIHAKISISLVYKQRLGAHKTIFLHNGVNAIQESID